MLTCFDSEGVIIMDTDVLTSLLVAVQARKVTVEDAIIRLKDLPFSDLGFAKIDHHRSIRRGFPEVIFCQSKTTSQILEIIAVQMAHHETIMGTRASMDALDAVARAFPAATINRTGRCFWVACRHCRPSEQTPGEIVIVSAGTADLPVAQEAATTCEAMGHPAQMICDVGIAGIHRLYAHMKTLRAARVIIVIAGMEGALPSVIAGLVDCPVIGVPTSVGYGSHLQGMVPLLAMLNSCASGMTVVNIDNGFGGAYAAVLINRVRADKQIPVKPLPNEDGAFMFQAGSHEKTAHFP
jgi:pyridinium-3,5-biscarboxylic acid mononucleotide synthase